MRLLSARIVCQPARASSGSTRAVARLDPCFATSAADTPYTRHPAHLSVSHIDAVLTITSGQSPAILSRPGASLCSAFSRQRSRVPGLKPTPRMPASGAARSGGWDRATGLSLNAGLHQACFVFHHRLRGFGFVEAAEIPTLVAPLGDMCRAARTAQ